MKERTSMRLRSMKQQSLEDAATAASACTHWLVDMQADTRNGRGGK